MEQESAFPNQHKDENGQIICGKYGEFGLTKREWYAGLAMQGILTQEKSVDENGNDIFITYEWVAITAFKIADAMLKQNKEPL